MRKYLLANDGDPLPMTMLLVVDLTDMVLLGKDLRLRPLTIRLLGAWGGRARLVLRQTKQHTFQYKNLKIKRL